ncbi:sigma-70 family RNA polymerase sigma factor [Actinokineospora enzanensis]|uniref:RNA polymerase sigma factor n=1 Tax=Actinokineospora enzanensis TaxID=155975 RepID=UPI00037AC008
MELWERVGVGDQGAFGELFQRHLGAVWNHGFRLTGSWEVAEDLASAAFLVAWRRRGDVVLAGDSLVPWLLTVVGNLVREERRGAWRRWRLGRRVAYQVAPVGDHAEDVVERLAAGARGVFEAIAALPRAQRRVAELCLVGEVDTAQAARVLGVGEATVRANLSRARARLRSMIGERG